MFRPNRSIRSRNKNPALFLPSDRHLVSRFDLGSVLQQQPYHPLVAVLGSQDEASLPVLRLGKAHCASEADSQMEFGPDPTPDALSLVHLYSLSLSLAHFYYLARV